MDMEKALKQQVQNLLQINHPNDSYEIGSLKDYLAVKRAIELVSFMNKNLPSLLMSTDFGTRELAKYFHEMKENEQKE